MMEVKQSPIIYIPTKPETTVVNSVPFKEKIVPPEIETTEEMAKEKLIEKVDDMNGFLETINTEMKFQFHEELGEYYVQVINTSTDQVIKEIPNKKFLDMYASMTEFAGLFVDEKL